jgi:integrase/recombinase XerD
VAGHADDLDGPMFRPLSHNRKGQESRRYMDPDAIDRVLRKPRKGHRADAGFFGAFDCAPPLSRLLWKTVQRSTMCSARQGTASPALLKLYDRRGYNPEKSASFFATY